MPIGAYYKGHGSEVLASMKKQYGPKKGESVFYATANKNKGMKPKSHMPKGASLSPKGDIGCYRQQEAVKAGGFKGGKEVKVSSLLPGKSK